MFIRFDMIHEREKIAVFMYLWRRPCDYHAICCMDGKTIQCLPNPSQHVPIYLQQFPSYSNRKCKNSPLSRTAAHIFISPGDAPATITQYVAWMERQLNACQTPRSVHLSIFNSFRVIRCLSQCVSLKIAIFTTFLPCDAMHSAAIAGMRCPSVRPSVRLSDTFVSCAKTNKDIFEIVSPSGSQAIVVFPYQTGWRYSNGNPLNWGVECKGGYEKIDDFRPIYRCISETVIVRWAHAARQFCKHRILFPSI